MFDLDRVLEGDCTLEFLKFEDDEGNWGQSRLIVFWWVILLLFCNSHSHIDYSIFYEVQSKGVHLEVNAKVK